MQCAGHQLRRRVFELGQNSIEGLGPTIEDVDDVRVVGAWRCGLAGVGGGHVSCDGIVRLGLEPGAIRFGSNLAAPGCEARDVFVGATEAGFQFEHSPITTQRLLRTLLIPEKVAQVVPGLGVVRFQIGGVEIREFGRLRILAQQHVCETVPGDRVARRKAQRAPEQFDGLIAPALAHPQYAEFVQRVRVSWLGAQKLQVDGFGLGQAALTLQIHSLVKRGAHQRECSRP